ncbi:hypothetical protein EMCRGX_G027592 [Ephydatia muelleri]
MEPDEEFKLLLAQLKHQVKLLQPEKRLTITRWIKKLLETAQRNERDSHARILLRMLRSGKIGAPFSSDPPTGSLTSLHEMYSVQPSEYKDEVRHQQRNVPSTICSAATSPTSCCHPPFSTSVTTNAGGQLLKALSDSSVSMKTGSGTTRGSDHKWTGDIDSRPPEETSSTSLSGFNGLELGPHAATPMGSANTMSLFHSTPSHPNHSTPSHPNHSTPSHPNHSIPSHPNQPQSTMGTSSHIRHQTHTPQGAPNLSVTPPSSSVTATNDLLLSSESTDALVTMARAEVNCDLSWLSGEESDASDVTMLLQSHPHPHRRLHPKDHTHRAPTSVNPSTAAPNPLGGHGPLDRTTSSPSVTVSTNGSLESWRKSFIPKQALGVRPSFSEDTSMKDDEMDVRAEFTKAHKFEAKCRKLEQRIAQLEHECKTVKNDRDIQLSQLKCKYQQQWQKLQAETDKKLHTLFTNFERDKLEMEHKHSQQLQATVERCGVQMKKMEDENSALVKTNSQLLSELETRVQELSRENELQLQVQSQLKHEKEEAERKCLILRDAMEQKSENVSAIERDLIQLRQERDSLCKQFQAQMDQRIQSLGYEHSIEKAKLAEQITELQHKSQDARKLEEVALELETRCQCRLEEKEAECREREGGLQQELNQAQERIGQLEMLLKDCREQIADANVTLDARSQQAEMVMEELKMQMGNQAAAMVEQLRAEIGHLETSLKESEASRDWELAEHRRQIQAERERMGKEIVQVKLEHEKVTSQLKKLHEQERVSCTRDARNTVVEECKASLADVERRAHSKAQQDAKTITSLEKQLAEVKGQLQESQFKSKLEMNELREKCAEEKQTLVKSHETSIAKLKVQLEFQKNSIVEKHRGEMDGITEKHNHRVHQLENEFAFRTKQMSEAVSALQAQIKNLEEDSQRQRQFQQMQAGEWSQRKDLEISSLKVHYEAVTQGLQAECDAAHKTAAGLEENMTKAQLEFNSKLSTLKMYYESRLKGMLPTSVKQEYESTISSLRTQVSILHQKTEVLQREIDRRQARTQEPMANSTSAHNS